MVEWEPMRWLNGFIVLGAILMAFFFAMPFLMRQTLDQEHRRFLGCQQHQRLDCEPSLIWSVQDWKN